LASSSSSSSSSTLTDSPFLVSFFLSLFFSIFLLSSKLSSFVSFSDVSSNSSIIPLSVSHFSLPFLPLLFLGGLAIF